MSATTSPALSATPSQTLTSSPDDGSNDKLAIILVTCLGGPIFISIAVYFIVKRCRKRFKRRAMVDVEHSQSTPTHGRNISEAVAPLLAIQSPSTDTWEQSSDVNGKHDLHDNSGAAHDPQLLYRDVDSDQAEPTMSRTRSATSARFPNPWTTSSDTPPADSAPISAPAPAPAPTPASTSRTPNASLRRSRTRIRAPMSTVPEDKIPLPAPLSPPLPPTPTDASEHSSWLRIPSTGPLISAFRRSLAASTSSRSTSMTELSSAMPTPAASSDALTFRSFPSGASSGHTPLPPPPPSAPDSRDLPARLRPSDPARVARLVPNSLSPGSRAASFLSGSARSGSELTVYTDARSNLDASELGERS